MNLFTRLGMSILVTLTESVNEFLCSANMAFAMYGAALGLVPPILVTLFVSPKRTQALGSYAMFAIGGGFAACWMAAGYGRLHGNGNLVFLSPVISASFAAIVMAVGLLARGPSLAAPAE